MSSEKERFANRLNDVLTDAGLPKLGGGRQSKFAKLLDVPSKQAGKWLKGEEFPPTSSLVKMAQMYNIRSNWLLSGNGEKYENDSNESANHEKHGVFNKEAFKVAMAWMKLTESQRKLVNNLIQELSRKK